MAKKPMQDNDSVKAALAAGEAPFGYKSDGTPRKRPPKPETPPELRSYYVVFGMPKHGAAPQRIGRFKSRLRAERWIDETGELLTNNYGSLEIVRCRRVDYRQLS